jgi:membrane associated rhomboid family serine protease
MIPIRDTIPGRSVPVATWTLIAVNVAVFLYEIALGPGELERLFYVFGIVPARYSHPEWAGVV